MELKVLNTLWVKQINKFADVWPRFTFRVEYAPQAPDAMWYQDAVNNLAREGLIELSDKKQYLLTDKGLRYCRDHYSTFPADMFFEQEEADVDKLKKVTETIPT